MPLPHYPSAKGFIEPIYMKLFEINILSDQLSEKQTELLTENFQSINKNILTINGDLDSLIILKKIKRFDFSVKVFDKSGKVNMILYYIDVQFDNFEYDILNFSYESDDLYRIELSFKFQDMKIFEEKQFERYIKFKNVI
jgi:hypothetical protein